MKILQLNAWTGRIKGALLDFFEKNKFDVICLQEAVWSNRDDILENFCVTVDQIKQASGLKNISKSPNWRMRFVDENGIVQQGNVILSREEIVSEQTESIIGQNKELHNADDLKAHDYTLQIVKLASGISVVNHHGYWLPTPIGDKTTVKAMKKVAGYVRQIEGPLIMCGDLNIIHGSPAMRELDFLHDLTEEYNIDNTLVGLKFNGKVACDHILVNKEIKVHSFETVNDLISDHKGLVAEIDY